MGKENAIIMRLRGEKASGYLEKHGVVSVQEDELGHVIGMSTNERVDTLLGTVIVSFATLACTTGSNEVAQLEAVNGSIFNPSRGSKHRSVSLNHDGIGRQQLGRSAKGIELVVERTVFKSK